jgi:hypothetical protein
MTGSDGLLRQLGSAEIERLWAGSPMPMNTTLRTGRRKRARATWATK